MSHTPASRHTCNRRAVALAAPTAAIFLTAHIAPALGGERVHRLQGLFCNTEEQIDQTLAHMSRAVPSHAAVELTNSEAIVCTWVDRLHYVVEAPSIIGEVPGAVPLVKYEATLTGVVVGGGQVREVSPPTRIFFAVPRRLANAPVESRV